MKKRKMLLVGPSFFGYRADIAKELIAKGWDVDELSDSPSESVRYKSLYKLDARFVEGEVERYVRTMIEVIKKGQYAVVFFVGGMTFPFSREQFDLIRSGAPATKFIAYLWDSVANCQRIGVLLESFDAIFSFEPDVSRNSVHLPLFFTEEYEKIANIPLDKAQCDACFVGSVHQIEKFRTILSIIDALHGNGLSVITHFYMPSRSSLVLRMVQDSSYRRRDIKFTHHPLSRSEVAALYAKCSCVIDSPQTGQIGLTMRTIEAIGAGRKLVTSNSAIENYDFFSYGDVFIPNGNVSDLVSFAGDRTRRIPASVRTRYSLKSWTDKILKVLEE